MPLPLLERATPDGLTFAFTRRSVSAVALRERESPSTSTLPDADSRLAKPHSGADGRMPERAPGPGEQYRFHFDMKKCIGCKCCVVACNEQNGNPAAINWRRVGEIEGGWFPNATRSYLSMGCNHCLEPTCLSGCPVDAYTKDPVTGIVRHSADACIGCQYCTWNCSYGVPQYNADRGVVGKCDMCHGRLSLGQAPACVSACPEGAIAIEIVNIADWRTAVATTGINTGLPADDSSLSTTRITLPDNLPPNAKPRDITHVTPEHPHWPLVVMTVLTQMSVGAFTTIWLLQLLGASSGLGIAALASLLVGAVALNASTLHLGRPVHAYRALRMWRRSWLSREVLLFTSFSLVAGLYAALLWLGGGTATAAPWITGGMTTAIGALTVVLGIAGVTASACIYRVPSRPAWNTRYTLLQFNLTGALLGPLFAMALGVGDQEWLAVASASMAGAQFVLLAVRFLRCIASDSLELKGTARLLSTVFAKHLVARGILLAAGAIVLPLLVAPAVLALTLAIAAEILGRYLFFVSVVPKHMAAPYVPVESEAA
ncbi:MAG TPA: DmsC/YnfH family molybdoenzyme membrane anchor subunit [Vicinamibacterales bacterium]|nr:DmsC/YnfH family molybdoenzyme membrane anchor subunit [Vicinamibacterales bacterium]